MTYQNPNFDKQDYWDRRKAGVPGTRGYVKLHAVVKDEDGNDQRVPLSGSVPASNPRTPKVKAVNRLMTKKGYAFGKKIK